MSKRLKEAGKTVLIVFLAVSALFLAIQTGLFNNFIDTLPIPSSLSRLFGSGSADTVTGEKKVTSAVTPLYAVVTSKYMDHCGIKYDSDTLSAFYTRISGVLGEVLTSAARPTGVTENEWKTALRSEGYFIEFSSPLPLSALLKSSDSALIGDGRAGSVRRLCVSNLQGKIYLYFESDPDGAFYCSSTTALNTALSAAISEYLPNETKFAFELGDQYSNADPYTILPKSSKIMSVNASNPLSGLITPAKILEQLRVSSILGTQYADSPNSDLFVAEQFTIRINSDGTVSYRVTDSNGSGLLRIESSAGVPTENEILEGARGLVSSTIGSVCGDKTLLMLTGFAYDSGNKSWDLTFDYYVNGILVQLPYYQHAATVKISGGYIMSAYLIFRNYTSTGNAADILPERQAAVLADSYSEPMPYYEDGKDGALTPMWTQN